MATRVPPPAGGFRDDPERAPVILYMSPLSLPPPPPDLVQHSTWTSMHATAVHVLPGMLRYLGVAEDDIDDLSQEVLLGAYTSLPRYNPEYSAEACGSASAPPPASAPPLASALPPASAPPASAPPASPPLQYFVSAVPADAADAADAAQAQDDTALPPDHRPAPRHPAGPSRPHGLGKHWRSEFTWLFGIAWRKVRHHLERAYRRHEVPVGLADAACFEGTDVAPSSEQRIATKERIAVATALLAKIPPERRAVLILADACEIPMREIARALELNENTVSSRLRLAREDYRAAVKRLRPEEQHALRSGLLMLPLFSVASSSSAAAARPVHSAAVETNAPATHPDLPRDTGQQDRADRSGRVARLARRARPVARLARPLARFLRPALEWGTAGVGGAAMVAALARAPIPWAERLGPVAGPLIISSAVDARVLSQREAHPGEVPRLGATSDKETLASRAPTPAPPSVLGQHKAATPQQHAPSSQDQDDEPLAEELRLLDSAKQALLKGDRTTAMERIAAHERRFPQGRLKLMRERLRSKMEAPPPAPAAAPAPARGATGQEGP
ncbi:sigma-70 family RNA polymerase sigma factor [Sorangium sp. So ce291]|uniref:RNA polymerase sigma factor n=1 Tax=Sorangium sp. So ce291 TaxID=3133294 RepID=UPI003F6450FF